MGCYFHSDISVPSTQTTIVIEESIILFLFFPFVFLTQAELPNLANLPNFPAKLA